MKVTLIHGNHTIKSRDRFTHIIAAIKKRGWEVVTLDPKSHLNESLTEQSLFETERLYVIDGSLEKISKIDSLPESNLLLYQGKLVPQKIIKLLPKNTKVEKFELPRTLFSFLDSLIPGNSKKCLTMLHDLLTTEPIELIFALMCTLYRDLYWASVDPTSLPYASWRAGKLQKQAKLYSADSLKSIITKLADIDIKNKTSAIDLPTSLDLFIVRELES